MRPIEFSRIKGIRVGHAQDMQAATGCTVILCEQGAVAGVDVRGGAPATRETDLLNPVNLVDQAHAILLTGGSAFGLDAAAGIMQYLEEKNCGFDAGVTRIPIVCGAALFDLMLGDSAVRPDKTMGYQACLAAGGDQDRQGCVGAGTGATAGKILGLGRAMKSGLGSYGVQTGELMVAALVAVNCLGDVHDPQTGLKLIGPLAEDRRSLLDTEAIMTASWAGLANLFSANTTIGVVATNAALSKAQVSKLASMAQDGYARSMRPAHTMFDGDTVFALSTGEVAADLSVVGLLAARVMERAVVAAAVSAGSSHGLPCCNDLPRHQVPGRP